VAWNFNAFLTAMGLPAELGYDGSDLAVCMRFVKWAIVNQGVFIDNNSNNSRGEIHMSIGNKV
jgi:hypothetical protein